MFLPKHFIFILLLFWAFSPAAYARERVDSYEKLNLLRKATGSERTSENSFQARVDAILNPNPDPESNYIAEQDAEARQAAKLQQQEERIDSRVISGALPAVKELETGLVKGQDVTSKTRNLVDGSEESYQKSLQEIQEKEKEKNIQEDLEPKKQEPFSRTKSLLPPSLANNPFYKGNLKEIDPIKKFEMMKPILISRLAQMPREDPMGQLDAERLVSQASSSDELIITVMKDNQNVTFQEASEITSVSDYEIEGLPGVES